MINLINDLGKGKQYPSTDIRHTLNTFNEDIIIKIGNKLRMLNPESYTGTVTVSEDRAGNYSIQVESSDATSAERITRLLQPYIDELNAWSIN